MKITKDDKLLLKAVFNSLMKDSPESLEQFTDSICEMDIVLADIINTFLKKGRLLPIPKINKDIHKIISSEYNINRNNKEGAHILSHYYLYKVGIATLLKYASYEEELTKDSEDIA